jgi:hypothetical protein
MQSESEVSTVSSMLSHLKKSHFFLHSGLICCFVRSRDEEQLIRSILTEVRSAMPATSLPAKQQYGVEESMRNVLKMLDSVSVLGLVGMGEFGSLILFFLYDCEVC